MIPPATSPELMGRPERTFEKKRGILFVSVLLVLCGFLGVVVKGCADPMGGTSSVVKVAGVTPAVSITPQTIKAQLVVATPTAGRFAPASAPETHSAAWAA